MLGSKKFLKSIRLRNFLSYGAEGREISLESLNVLIGPNSSGKSNLFEALGILKATPSDLTEPVRQGGGINEWLWKGRPGTAIAEIEITAHNNPQNNHPLRYRLSFTMVNQRMELVDEVIENEHPIEGKPDVFFYYRYMQGRPVLNVRTKSDESQDWDSDRRKRYLQREDLDLDQSVLSQRKDPDQYPELTYLSSHFSKIKLYREWSLGRYTVPRLPQKPDLPEDFLLEDASNLGLVLNSLEHKAGLTQKIVMELRKFYPQVENISMRIHGGTVQVFLHERGLIQPIPATRLSDGTLRYLCLLVVLCHPSPPPVVCIEEPELGLHPDIIPIVAELLIEASHRTQLFVTTHSDVLVSALSEVPEAIIVCDREEDGTVLTRLDQAQLKKWLEEYSLGELWLRGDIGGNPE